MKKTYENFFRFGAVLCLFVSLTCCSLRENVADSMEEAELSFHALLSGMSESESGTKGYVIGSGGADAFTDIANPAAVSGGPYPPRDITLGAWNSTRGTDYFTGERFARGADGIWHATPKRYYPLRSSIDLLAFSSGNGLRADWDSGHKATLLVTDTQDDIMYASNTASSMTPGVTMTFRHSQAWIEFRLSSNVETLHINSIYWEDVYRKGALHLAFNENEPLNPLAEWDFFTQDRDTVNVDDPYGVLEGNLSTDSNAPTQLNMLLPEQPHGSFVILYTLNGKLFAKRISAESLTSTRWERSRRYTYTIKFVVSPITIVPTVDIWVEEVIDRLNSIDVITGLFSVSDTTKVAFSKGNLQYRPSDGRWRFAEHQWDCIGGEEISGTDTTRFGNVARSSNNPAVVVPGAPVRDMTDVERSTCDSWFDLFGWGTSGINPGNGKHCQPWETDTLSVSGYGPDVERLTGANDWGSNLRVFEFFHRGGEFRTLQKTEWEYLLWQRSTKCGHRWFSGELKYGYEESVCGLFLLPDEFVWLESFGPEPKSWENADPSLCSIDNTIGGRFDKMESSGVAFIPYSGFRDIKKVSSPKNSGLTLWSSTSVTSGAPKAYCVCFNPTTGLAETLQGEKFKGFTVRLVTDFNRAGITHSSEPIEKYTDFEVIL